MTMDEILGDLRDYVTSRPNDEETQMAMVAALLWTAAVLTCVRARSRCDNEAIRAVVLASGEAMDGEAEKFPLAEMNRAKP